DVQGAIRADGQALDSAELLGRLDKAGDDTAELPVGREPNHLMSAWVQLLPAADVVEVAVGVNDQRGATVGNEGRLGAGRRPPLEPPGPMLRFLEVHAGEAPFHVQGEPVPGLLVDLGELAFRVDLPQARVDVGNEDVTFLVYDDTRAGMGRDS